MDGHWPGALERWLAQSLDGTDQGNLKQDWIEVTQRQIKLRWLNGSIRVASGEPGPVQPGLKLHHDSLLGPWRKRSYLLRPKSTPGPINTHVVDPPVSSQAMRFWDTRPI
ncbi:hypothetical protein GCM10009077_00780 [Roseibium denhamense]|uniref:Uncharacterized protein n=1 Tax=Roseibium denhamense TaxID=76305 RepID=A0ABY1PHL9_9HYPH|nr:hypothetical protein SAMN06265374_3500 [Roseibium denhamense]